MHLHHRPTTTIDLVGVVVHRNVLFAMYVTFLVITLVAGMIYVARR
jgi:hypothetical protein